MLSRRAKFVLLEGTLGKMPVRFSVQVSGKQGTGQLEDGSSGYLLDQRLTVAFPNGLLATALGCRPVLWNSTPAHVSEAREALWSVSCDHETQTVAKLREQRIQANVEALNSIRKSILGHGTPATQQPKHILQVSQAWETIGRQLYSV